MATKAVHWHEGMFLRPHHYQAAYRNLGDVTHLHQKWNVHYNWGLRSVEIDPDALTNFRFVVDKLQARLRDGTVVSIPEDGELEPLSLRKAFTQGNRFVVSLAIPVLALGQVNATANPERPARYLIDTVPLEDENTGTNPKPIQVRRLNLKLVTSLQEPPGHELLPVARLEKSNRAEAAPQVDAGFIPPLLACDGWPPLQVDVLQALYDRITKKTDLLTRHVLAQGLTFDSGTQGAPLLIQQLRELNEALSVLHVIAFTPGVHPVQAFLELSRVAGQLAIFGDRRRLAELPHYDHDDLARCFFSVKRAVDLLLDTIDEPAFDERAFVGAGYRIQVALEGPWLEAGRQIFIAVQSPLPEADCVRLLTESGQLDMKVAASARVEEVFRGAAEGLHFAHAAVPPRVLPRLQGRVYFQVNRGSQESEWEHVHKTLSLAVRVNEKLLVGNIQGQRVFTVKFGGKTVPLEFILYVTGS